MGRYVAPEDRLRNPANPVRTATYSRVHWRTHPDGSRDSGPGTPVVRRFEQNLEPPRPAGGERYLHHFEFNNDDLPLGQQVTR